MNLEELKQFMTEVEAHINDSSNDYGLQDTWHDLVYKTKDDMSIIIENRHSERTGDDYDYCEEVYYIEFNGKSCFIEFGGYYNSWDGTDFDYGYTFVKPVVVTKTVYEYIKG